MINFMKDGNSQLDRNLQQNTFESFFLVQEKVQFIYSKIDGCHSLSNKIFVLIDAIKLEYSGFSV